MKEVTMKKMTQLLLLLLLVAVIGGVPARADVMNSVKGIICDQKTNLPIADVRISLVSTRVQTFRIELTSGSDGSIYKNGIPTGGYEVQFEKEGYFPARSSIRLTIGDNYDISVKLEPVPDQNASGAGLLRSVVELVNSDKFAEGIAKAGEGLGKEPANAMLHYYRGYCQEKSGNAAAAIVDYGRAVELKPDFALALTSLGKLQARQGNFTKAAEYYKKACELQANNADALYNYGICLVNLGDNAEAGKTFEKVLAIDAGHADACYQLGIVLLGQGDMAKAKEYLQKFLTLDPQHKDAATAKAIIDSLK
jgi:tetratricopeptide (TPR) repeat protein